MSVYLPAPAPVVVVAVVAVSMVVVVVAMVVVVVATSNAMACILSWLGLCCEIVAEERRLSGEYCCPLCSRPASPVSCVCA